MKVKEFCLRSFFFSFVGPVWVATVIIGLLCRRLSIDYLYGYGVLVIFVLVLSWVHDHFVLKKYELACFNCGKKGTSDVFWQKRNCVCGGKIIVRGRNNK